MGVEVGVGVVVETTEGVGGGADNSGFSVGTFPTLVLTLGVGVDEIDGDEEGDAVKMTGGRIIEGFAALLLVVDQGKTLVVATITTAINVVIFVNMI